MISEGNKRQKYLNSIILSLILVFYVKSPGTSFNNFLLISLIISVVGSYFTHRPNTNLLNTLVVSIVPSVLVSGMLLSLRYFPNLSVYFKFLSIIVFATMFYVISLVNNVFLVVEHRKEQIPLYRVAITWGKILVAGVSIPMLAGIFKISLNAFYQSIIATSLSLLFFGYTAWSLRYSSDVKKYKVGEILSILLFSSFLVGISNVSVSFFPTESFLRAIYVSSIMLFGMSYIESHLKNQINKKIMSEHLLISLIFLILLIIFRP